MNATAEKQTPQKLSPEQIKDLQRIMRMGGVIIMPKTKRGNLKPKN